MPARLLLLMLCVVIADGRAHADKFSGAYSHRVLDGIGHNVPQEAPGAFTDAILEVGGGLA